jgi:hypothetical protein
MSFCRAYGQFEGLHLFGPGANCKRILEHSFGTSSKFDSSGKVLFAVEGVVFLVNQKEMSA